MARITELGQLYTAISSFVREKEGRPNMGTIEQSLCHHLLSQLTDYYRMVAVLESHMATGSTVEGNDNLNYRGGALTLRRLDMWVDDWRLRMRMMSVCVEGAKGTTFLYFLKR